MKIIKAFTIKEVLEKAKSAPPQTEEQKAECRKIFKQLGFSDEDIDEMEKD